MDVAADPGHADVGFARVGDVQVALDDEADAPLGESLVQLDYLGRTTPRLSDQ